MNIWAKFLGTGVSAMALAAFLTAHAQVVGYVETTIEDNEVSMSGQATMNCEQENSGGLNSQSCGLINADQGMIVGYAETEIEGNTVTMDGNAEISCEQSNSGGSNAQSCGLINVS